MAVNYGPVWTVKPNTLRFTPSYTPKILMHIESAGSNDASTNRNQYIAIGGTQVLNATSPRSYRASRLVWNNGWTFHSSNGYDVYGTVGQDAALLAYLQTFNTADILVLNTWDEPLGSRAAFKSELINSFKATLQDSPIWGFRCSYQLIASKNKGVIFEDIHAPASAISIDTTLYLG
jgi:hypothetical protein